jgi:hypothetical protein
LDTLFDRKTNYVRKKKMIRKKQSEIGLLAKQDSNRIPENPLGMCDSDREEDDCL